MLIKDGRRLLISDLLLSKCFLVTLLLSLTASSFLAGQSLFSDPASRKPTRFNTIADFGNEGGNHIAQRLPVFNERVPTHGGRQYQKKLKFKLRPSKISLLLGGNYQMPTGSYIKSFKKDISSDAGASGLKSDVNGNLAPILTFMIGTGSSWQISKKFLISSGLRFTQQGYKLELSSTYSDPRYQYDETISFRQRIKTSVLVVPLSGVYQISANDNLEFGVMIGVILKGSMKVSSSFDDAVFINGEKDEAESKEETEISLSSKESTKALTPAIFCSYFRTLTDKLQAGISAHYTGKYMSFEDGNVANRGLTLSLKYDIQL